MKLAQLRLRWTIAALGMVMLAIGADAAGAPAQVPAPVNFPAAKDNTLYETSGGFSSNGAGQFLFAGTNNSGISRRGAIAFDVADKIPAGSTITSVKLTLHVSRTDVGARTVSLHKLLAGWGEGTSKASGNEGGGAAATAGDATWIHRFFDTQLWETPGGDFKASSSTSIAVDAIGSYTWGTTPQMVADVQVWLDNPATNFGWLLNGDETQRSAKRFDSRENETGSNQPVLLVEYTMPLSVIQFGAASYAVAEGVGSAAITITRSGSGAGEVSVDYAAGGGTATPAKDYKGASGKLTFADGDTADKTITIPVVDDGFFEPPETLQLALSNPSGGASLGGQSATTVTITDNDAIAGDLDLDGVVGIRDLLIVTAGLWPPGSGSPEADVNGDGVVGVCDLAIVAHNLDRMVPQPLSPMALERVFPHLSFNKLTNLVEPNDRRGLFFATEQTGRILVFPNDQGASQAEVFLDLQGRVNPSPANEEGLLGLAFDPGYKENGYFYVYYSATSPRRSVVSRFSVNAANPNEADPNSELVVLEIPQPFSNHNGGQLAFGPDGFLYIALGDGSSGGGDPQGNAQNRDTLLGSLLRIDVSGGSDGKNYRIPADNPFVGVSGARDEIWAYGLRNPWRFTFDRQTGDLWLADVGESAWEEVDLIRKGRNYGWNTMEGAHCFSPSSGCDQTGLELPVAEYGHSDGCSITGGKLFRGRGTPSLLGAYVYGDFCSGKIWGLRYDGVSVTELTLLVESAVNISSFAEDRAGNLYVLGRIQGIYGLVPAD